MKDPKYHIYLTNEEADKKLAELIEKNPCLHSVGK